MSERLSVGAAAGELDRRRLDALDRPEHDLVVERVDDDRLAGVEFLPQDLLRERVLDMRWIARRSGRAPSDGS